MATVDYHEAIEVKKSIDGDIEEPIPQHILDDIEANKSVIYWSLCFLDASVMWAYYSCLSAQDYYKSAFPSVQFVFLTTPVLTWPLSIGHIIQMWFGLDRSLGNMKRVIIGYAVFAICCVVIIVQGYLNMSQAAGSTLVLVCFGFVGAAHSLTEPAYYNVASLFPDARFTNAIQVGNVIAGVLNVIMATLIHLAVGGVHDSDQGQSFKLSFFIFMAMLFLICIAAVIVYARLEKIPCVRYLLDRAAADHVKHGKVDLIQLWAKFFRVGRVIILPLVAQFMLFFCTLTLFPGIGCASAYQKLGGTNAAPWLCSPGIIMPFNLGDFIGRVSSTQGAVNIFSMRFCFFTSLLRWGWLPLLLLGVPSSSLYSFGDSPSSGYALQIVLYVFLGITGGLFSTVTMGLAPRLVAQEDREAAAALMVMALFLGLSSGSTFGWGIGNNGWFGL
ncbi:Equilibrative Nucleoside Transporter (ENT) Family [Thraustotheca clavata]|uniref:Equilibrative Nucleoside Transporter (ENT) Family n=1 Tax=Thraustotheca clavata TaxID=74557 RepID=A0A1V9ZBQ5_9STRA|nr:Equilibrative Nucleoside Transporter (ENT) Family [Thraustotheca clavata]